jgi:hypothetical protein
MDGALLGCAVFGAIAGVAVTAKRGKSKRLPQIFAALPAEGQGETPADYGLKKPLTAFFMFSNDERAGVREQSPDLTLGQVAKELGVRWKNLDAGTKADYEREAKAAKEKYAAALAELPPHVQESVKSTRKPKVEVPGMKKPLSAFFAFCGDDRPAVKAANPTWTLGQVTKELGARWANLDADLKAEYEREAKAAKDKYDAALAELPLSVKGRSAKKPKVEVPGMKKPLSAFFQYSADERANVKAQNPDLTLGQISKELGVRWANLEAERKSAYEREAQVAKEKYAAALAAVMSS